MNNENILFISSKIYARDIVISAVEAFHKLALIRVQDSEDAYICKFIKCRYDISRTMMEFENYVIGLSNQHGEKSGTL